ncbi:MAG: exodeoxyribonuclease V subunit gamma [Candidatus Binatus sp.]
MIRLYYSNRLENLIAPLAQAVAAHQRREPLEPVSIVVPNRVVEQYVRYRVAEAIGVAANLKFPFLRNYLAEILHSSDKSLWILDADELQLLIFECLRSQSGRDASSLKPALDYIRAGSKTDADIEVRTMLLAAQLARLFREYSISRRRMIKRWRIAQRAEIDAMTENERWQRHLWQSIFDLHGRVREQWLSDRRTRLMMLPDAFEAMDNRLVKSALPETLHVFGPSYAGNAYSDIFARLGALADIRIYALNPCREFWEDVDTSHRGASPMWARRQDRVGEKLAESEDPFSLNESSDPPALRLWGRPGREYVRLLNELSQCDFVPLFSDPVSAQPPTLLETLQQTILDREPPPANVEDGKGRSYDARIRFLACPGIRREAEIVANEIWSIIRDNEKLAADGDAGRIRFHQIAVLIPDAAVDDYAAQLESVFRKQHHIPIDFVSRSIAGASRVAEGVELLLQLPSGRFSRAEMIRLLTHPALNNESETGIGIERWARWSESLGIFFGADDDDLKDTYIPHGLYHWDQAIKRLALGTMMTGERGGNPPFYETGADAISYLPFEVEQDEVETAARFIHKARSLIADAISMRGARLTPREWSRMIIEFVSAYIQPDDALDEHVRDGFLEAIEAIGDSALKLGPMSYESAHEMITVRVTDLESRRGQYSGRGIAVGSISSLRSIPFRVVFALGLNEAVFPQRDHREPLDLRTLKRVAGEVTPAERDRYLFLETILAARERLYFSYIDRDAKTGDTLKPSSAIRELQYLLRGFVDEKTLAKLTVNHPVSGCDLRYFPEINPHPADSNQDPALITFDPEARSGARMIALREKLRPLIGDAENCRDLLNRLAPKLRGRLEGELQFAPFERPADAQHQAPAEEIALPIAAIRRYLESPLQGAARHALGILEDEDAPDESDDEPLGQSRLDRTVMLRDVFWRARDNLELLDEEYARAVRIAQCRGHASAGQFAQAASDADKCTLRKWIDEASAAGVSDLRGWRDIRIGRADEFADAGEILPPIGLDVDVRRHDGSTIKRRVGLYGTIRWISLQHAASLQCVLHKSAKPKDFLPAFINAIALAAAGVELPKQFRALVLRSNPDKESRPIREFATMDRESACSYLSAVVGDLLSAGNNYFLPIDAVEKVVEEIHEGKQVRDLVDTVEQVLLNDGRACSSDYGPVRNPRDFAPPDEAEIQRIVERRFGPIVGIFS